MAIDLEQIRAKFQKHQHEEEQRKKKATEFKKHQRLELTEGDNWIRVCPPYGENELPWVEGQFHFKVDPAGKRKIVCIGAGCPVCAETSRLFNEGTPVAIDRAREIKKATRYLFNALKMTKDGKIVLAAEQDAPYLFETGKKLWEEITGIICEYGDITSLKTGRTLKVVRKGTGRYTSYTVLPVAEPSDLGKKDSAWVMKSLNDFAPDVTPNLTKEQITEIMEGVSASSSSPSDNGSPDNDSEDVTDETPACFGDWEEGPPCDECAKSEPCAIEAKTK